MRHGSAKSVALAFVIAAVSNTAALADDQLRTVADGDCFGHGVRLFIGDQLSCVSRDTPDPGTTTTGEPVAPYEPKGANFPIKGRYGTPVIPPDPKGGKCGPAIGHGSQDQPPPERIYEDPSGRRVARFVVSARWDDGYGGPDGFSSAPLDVYMNPDGTGGFVGREMFEGTIDGRTGSIVNWVEGTFDSLKAGGKYIGYNYTVVGMEGLRGLQQKAYFVGVFGKGYDWVQPGVYCWNGFDSMYHLDGTVRSDDGTVKPS